MSDKSRSGWQGCLSFGARVDLCHQRYLTLGPKRGCFFGSITYIIVIMANLKKKLTDLSRYDYLAKKYYNGSLFAQLPPHRKDKVITWVTNHNPDTGSNRDRRRGRTLGRYIKGKL